MPDVKYLFTRRLNQNPLENFFGKVRSMNDNAFNPTSIQFYFTFRKLFAIQYCNIDTGNCAADKDESLINISEFNQPRFIVDEPIQETEDLLDDHDYRNFDLTEENAFRYICGYLIRKCFKKHTCDTCTQFSTQ